HAVEPPPPLSDDIPARVRAVVSGLLQKIPAARPDNYASVLALITEALEEPDPSPPCPPPLASESAPDAISLTQLAAARAALSLGRQARAQDMLRRLVVTRSAGWSDAAFLLASILERGGDLTGACDVLDHVAAEGATPDIRAFALWSLGRV